MSETIEQLKEENDKLKREIQLYQLNGPIGLYYELNRFVNDVVTIMRGTKVQSLLSVSEGEDPKKFERMMALIKNAKEHVQDMNDMRSALGLSGNEDEDKKKPFVDTIAEKRN